MSKFFSQQNKSIQLYIAITALTGLALGLSDGVFANYFKDVYNVDALQRGFIEFPRELPGLLCTFVIMGLSFLGDKKSAIVAQLLSVIGLMVLGLTTPSFNVMLIFLFIYSLGAHTYMPLGDSIGLSLVKEGSMGKLIGQFNGVRTAFTMIAGIVTFLGFRFGIFGFRPPISVFLLSALLFLAIAILFFFLVKSQPSDESNAKGKVKFVFKRAYLNYYILCMLFGGRKQIMFVYSPWVLIELLGFKTDTMALLAVVGSFIGIFFMPLVGKLIDKFGVRKMMMVEAFSFIIIYMVYGFLSAGLNAKTVAISGIAIILVYLLNIIDRMTAQFGMVRSLYMRSIAIVPEDITPSLSLGISLDHGVAIAGSALCGWIWYKWGPEYVFMVAGILSFLNLIVAYRIKQKVVKL